jgi:uncharacterized SAM-binding protein YcdF (DUF218 family)
MRQLKRIFVTGSVCFTLLFALFEFTPLLPWYARWLAGPWKDPKGDILIVLANDAEPGDIIGQGSYWRCFYAILAWREGHYRSVVVSGGGAGQGHASMAAVMGRFLASNGIPEDRIFLEERSNSTRENALFTARMIGGWPGRKVLLTSDYHIFRAQRAFAAAGLPVVPTSFPDIQKNYNDFAERPWCFFTLADESAKIVWYWQKGWIG